MSLAQGAPALVLFAFEMEEDSGIVDRQGLPCLQKVTQQRMRKGNRKIIRGRPQFGSSGGARLSLGAEISTMSR